MVEDFSTEPQPLHSESVSTKRSGSSSYSRGEKDFLFVLLYLGRGSGSTVQSNKEAFEASKKTVRRLQIHIQGCSSGRCPWGPSL